jgi:pyoverdine/dityrosine biosynthesis protein Dit1
LFIHSKFAHSIPVCIHSHGRISAKSGKLELRIYAMIHHFVTIASAVLKAIISLLSINQPSSSSIWLR